MTVVTSMPHMLTLCNVASLSWTPQKLQSFQVEKKTHHLNGPVLMGYNHWMKIYIYETFLGVAYRHFHKNMSKWRDSVMSKSWLWPHVISTRDTFLFLVTSTASEVTIFLCVNFNILIYLQTERQEPGNSDHYTKQLFFHLVSSQSKEEANKLIL